MSMVEIIFCAFMHSEYLLMKKTPMFLNVAKNMKFEKKCIGAYMNKFHYPL